MNGYLIEHKINTLTYLWEDVFEHAGYEFRDWNPTKDLRTTERGWIAKKNIEACDLQTAINTFRNDLSPIVDRISSVSQCFATFELESFVAIKLTNNPENIFFFLYSREREATGLHFGEGQRAALMKMDNLENPHALRYLRESNNAMSFYTRLAMLLSSLEALAGEVTVKGGSKRTDKDRMRDEILGGDQNFFDEIMKYGDGIRNKIFHGAKIDLTSYLDIVPRIYSKVVEYFNKEFDLKIDIGVVNPQRTPFGNYVLKRYWRKPTSGKPTETICLKSLTDEFSEDDDPSSYSYVEAPEEY